MISPKLVFRSLQGRCCGNRIFLFFLSTELIFDTALASGMAKRAGTSLFPASSVFVRYSVGRALIHVGRRM